MSCNKRDFTQVRARTLVLGLLLGSTGAAFAHQAPHSTSAADQPIPIQDRGSVSYVQLPCSTSTSPSSASVTSGTTAAVCNNGSTHELSFSSDGTQLWVSQMTAQRILHFDVKGTQIVASSMKVFPTPIQPHGVIADGKNVWITLEDPTSQNALEKLDSDGNVLDYIPLRSGAGPHGIDIAPDGSIWFSGKEGSLVGRANPKTHEVKYYDLPPNTNSIYVHVAHNNDVWFTELNGNAIGRIRNDVVTQIPLPQPNSLPISIETDNTGGVWFTEADANVLGYIPPKYAKGSDEKLVTSVIRQFTVPTAGATPAGATVTPAGQVWFGGADIDLMIKLNKAKGQLYEYSLGTTNSVWHRTDSLKGVIFWTELNTDRIGRFVPNR